MDILERQTHAVCAELKRSKHTTHPFQTTVQPKTSPLAWDRRLFAIRMGRRVYVYGEISRRH